MSVPQGEETWWRQLRLSRQRAEEGRTMTGPLCGRNTSSVAFATAVGGLYTQMAKCSCL